MDLQTLQSLIRNNPQWLTGGARGDNAFYRENGGDSGYGLTYSPEWMNAVNDTTPYQQGDNGWFWSDGNQSYTPSALKAAQLSGTANPADYVTGFNPVNSFSNDAYAGNSQWKGESFLTPAMIGLAMAYGMPYLMGEGAGGLYGLGTSGLADGGAYIDALGDVVGGEAAGAWTGAYPSFNTGYIDALGDSVGGAVAGSPTTGSWWQNALDKVSGSKDAMSALSKAMSSFGTTPTIDTGTPYQSYGQSNAVASTPSTPNTLESPTLSQSALTASPQTNNNYGFTDLAPANDAFLRAGSTWNTRMANALRTR